jgi:hypothetical protein
MVKGSNSKILKSLQKAVGAIVENLKKINDQLESNQTPIIRGPVEVEIADLADYININRSSDDRCLINVKLILDYLHVLNDRTYSFL